MSSTRTTKPAREVSPASRRAWDARAGTLDPTRRQRLDDLGFVWDTFTVQSAGRRPGTS